MSNQFNNQLSNQIGNQLSNQLSNNQVNNHLFNYYKGWPDSGKYYDKLNQIEDTHISVHMQLSGDKSRAELFSTVSTYKNLNWEKVKYKNSVINNI